MSLINDALKRTKDVQQQTPPAAGGPTLRPVEPGPTNTGSGARTLLYIMVLAVVLGNFLLWLAFKDRDAQPPASSIPASAPAAAQTTPTPPVTTQPLTEPGTTVLAAVAPTPTEPVPAARTETPAPAALEPQSDAVTTNAPDPEPKVVFADPPKPTVLRLQSIIYGTRPSAMIGGKFLSIGDSIQGHQVIAIGKETVTLVGGGETNILSLP